MLQIISGKFFTRDERHIHDGKGVLYSNFSWCAPIRTCVGTLEPVEYAQDISLYVFSYTNQIEQGDTLVRTGDAEIVDQFGLLCTFGLRASFAALRSEIEHLCRHSPASGVDRFVPGHFVPRFSDRTIRGIFPEVERFIRLVEKVIGLRRDVYLTVMTVLNSLRNALQAVSYNIDLAYSMLVYCLEALSQRYDQFQPQWTDYDEGARRKLDPLLEAIDPNTAEAIRAAITGPETLRLQKRFVQFAVGHVSDSYYRQEASGLRFPLRPSETRRALRNAYLMRSKFTHTLEPIREQLRIPHIAEGDTFHWEGEPYLTLSGLLRLTLHVLTTFIERSETVEKEMIDWRGQLPGMVRLEVAPRYWIWQTEGFKPPHARQKLSGLLEHITQTLATPEPLPDMAALLERIEALLPQAKDGERIPMLAVYWLYNAVVVPEGRRPGWEELLRKHEPLLATCCLEMMAVRLILFHELAWPLHECIAAYEDYGKHRYGKASTKLPILLETGLLALMANMALAAQEPEKRRMLIETAIGEAAGRQEVQDHLLSALEAVSELDVEFVLRGGKAAAPPSTPVTPES